MHTPRHPWQLWPTRSHPGLGVLLLLMHAAAVPGLAAAQASPASAAEKVKVDDKALPALLSAELITGRTEHEIKLERGVEIQRGGTTIHADKACYRVVEDEVDAEGGVRILRNGDVHTGDRLKLRLDTDTGFMLRHTYRLAQNQAQGNGARIDFLGEDRFKVTDGTYSTCDGPNPDWYLKASTIDLDTAREIGSATGGSFVFKGVAVPLPLPSFPLSKARRSGFLMPMLDHSNKGGVALTVPYYFDIAPNRDLTLYPKLISQRGLQLSADVRYMGETYSGDSRIETLFYDRQTKSKRYSLASVHHQALLPNLSWYSNLNAASDDNYPNDFANSITHTAMRVLPRDVLMTYHLPNWRIGMRISNYQVLQDALAPIARPYDRLPQFNLQGWKQDWHGLDLALEGEATRFWHPANLSSDPLYANPSVFYPRSGNRVSVTPSVTLPLVGAGYFLNTKLAFDLTNYHLDNDLSGAPRSLTRALPTLSLDGGLVFERKASPFGQSMTQTLEPRLFYVYTPYHDQSRYPIFDTGETNLSFAQIFTENRYTGHDRISDANQITAALVSRFIEPDGTERMRFALAQRFYLTQPRVTLTTPAGTASRSDLLASAYGQVSKELSADLNLQYSQSLRSLVSANFGARWQPGRKQVLNVAYRRDIRDELAPIDRLKQFEVSGQWPIGQRWFGMARANYSIPDRKIAEGLLGLEYRADCWGLRIVSQRIPTGTRQATSRLLLQLELNGLGQVGFNALGTLQTGIPGYGR